MRVSCEGGHVNDVQQTLCQLIVHYNLVGNKQKRKQKKESKFFEREATKRNLGKWNNK